MQFVQRGGGHRWPIRSILGQSFVSNISPVTTTTRLKLTALVPD